MKKYKKKRVKKYNKFFSYKNADRAKRNFSYKDFGYSESYNTKFTGSLFYGNDFYRATMKYCGFNGCTFRFVEFKSVNFKGSRFKGAIFENVLFDNCKLEKADFHGAVFRNVYCVNTGLKKTKGISSLEKIVQFNGKVSEFDFGEKLIKAILYCEKNEYIMKSDTLYKRNAKTADTVKMINRVNIIRLLDAYSEDEIVDGLHLAADSIDKSFNSLSYFLPYIRKAQENIEGSNKDEG